VKRCSRCGESKPLETFPRQSNRRDGRNCWCKDCHRQWARDNSDLRRTSLRRWRERYPERVRQYTETHKDEQRERGRRYDRAHREKCRAKNSRWYAEHPDWNRERSHRRRALERGSHVEPVDRQAIYDRDDGICHLCGEPVPRENFTLDHLVPISLGGPHTSANVAIAHASCNFRRGTKSVEEFRRSLTEDRLLA